MRSPSTEPAPEPPAATVAAVRARLREVGLRATPARIAVYRVLLGKRAPMSHAEVCEAVAGGGFDRATVYRNLVDLADAGLLRRADLGDHVWRFERRGEGADPTDEEHPHFVCSECGGVTCLPDDAVTVAAAPHLPRSLRDAVGGTGKVAIQIRGTCDDCD